MKIFILADQNSSHTIKWKRALIENGLDVKIWGFDYSKPKILQLINVRNEIKKFNPDILHAHYASSYGFIGALFGGKYPFLLSVWGSDVFEFPRLSFINKYILKYNFLKANKIMSTSNIMANQTNLYTRKDIIVTPFGVDCDDFKPTNRENEIITIGIIKSLKKIYAIDYAIKAFNEVLLKSKDKKIKLMIVGGGDQEKELKNLVGELNISKYVDFVGKVDYDKIPNYHSKIDIFINISLQESFGVSVLESSSCEKPVIVSNVGGLPEVVEDGVTGIIVPYKNYIETAKAVEKLLYNKELRIKMGKAGRKMVKNKYNWNDNVSQMINIYKDIIA